MAEREGEGVNKWIIGATLGLFAAAVIYKHKTTPRKMIVKELYVYPIKSCSGIRISQATFDKFGFQHDRKWVIVNENGDFVHQRKYPQLATVKVEISSEFLEISAPNKPTIKISLKTKKEKYSKEELVRAAVWGVEEIGIDEGEEAAKWLSNFLQFPVRLVRRYDEFYHRDLSEDTIKNNRNNLDELPNEVSFVDEHPILLISKSSLRDLNQRLIQQGKKTIKMNRFRANIIIDDEGYHADDYNNDNDDNNQKKKGIFSFCSLLSGKENIPYVEDQWRKIKIGDVEFYSAEKKTRCVMTTVNQETGKMETKNINENEENINYLEPLSTLRQYRLNVERNSPIFGQTFSHTISSISKSIYENQFVDIIS